MECYYFMRVFITCLVFLVAGCTTVPMTTCDVPFRPQKTANHCGVNCLAMTLDYFDVDYVFHELKRNVFIPALNGTTPELLADAATDYGIDAEIRKMGIPEMLKALKKGKLPDRVYPTGNK
jgi:ABC-type bacteriocin/lantibiotic exporter with double-glycine peptidase domain